MSKIDFEIARKLYPGRKRGLATEFTYFCKVTRDWQEVLPKLLPAIKAQIKWRKNTTDKFIPAWKDFSSWIYNRYWEMENEPTPEKQKHKCWGCGSEQVVKGTNTANGTIWQCQKPECKKAVQAEIDTM